MPHVLTSADRQAIAEAIAEAERSTAGEIYCIVARRSADYREVPLAWAAGAALLLPLVAVLLGWSPSWPTGWMAQSDRLPAADAITAYAALQALLFAAVAALVSIPVLKARLIPSGLKRARVRRAALDHFLAKGLQNTEARTGVLIYASLAEHRVEVVADQTIHRQVDPDVWADAVEALTAALRAGRPAEGFIQAVRLCGAVLADRFPPRPGDANELPDRLAEI
jgi:putative membrane protein